MAGGWWMRTFRAIFDTMDHELLLSVGGATHQRSPGAETDPTVAARGRSGKRARGSATEMGSPQGGVISPLLANIYLHMSGYVLGRTACRRWGNSIATADDFVIVCRSKRAAQAGLRERSRTSLRRLKLTLHPTKTHDGGYGEAGFDFLGFHFHKRPYRKRTQTSGALHVAEPKGHEDGAREDCTDTPSGTGCGWTLSELVGVSQPGDTRLAGVLSRSGTAAKKLADLDRYVRLRLRRLVTEAAGARGRWDAAGVQRLLGAAERPGVLLPSGTART